MRRFTFKHWMCRGLKGGQENRSRDGDLPGVCQDSLKVAFPVQVYGETISVRRLFSSRSVNSAGWSEFFDPVFSNNSLFQRD